LGRPAASPAWTAGRPHRRQGVGLALAPAGGPVGPVDLEDLLAVGAQEAGQRGAVAAGPLDPERGDFAELPRPVQQVLVASRAGGHQRAGNTPAELVTRGCDVHLAVGVDPDSDAGGLGCAMVVMAVSLPR
jgi:hypothetical protein